MRRLVLLLSTLFIFKISAVVAQVNVQDSLALVDLYDSAGGDNWTYKWYFYNPVIYWGGVHVNGNRVTSIELRHNNLVGTIPSSIGNISNLDSLTLSENYLTGKIPTSVGQLNKLTMLDLAYNQLSGNIPSSLGQLANLQYLWLYSNQLSDTIPSSVGQLSKLIELKLSANQLTGKLPISLSNLSNLKILWLSGNQLSGTIPPSLGQLTNLEQLYLSLNQFSGNIPPSLGQLSYLQKLVLGNNQLTDSIPPELGQLSNLTDLDLGYNQLLGPVPSSLTHFSKFEQMYLFFNRFNFDGLEAMVTAYPNAFAYAPQANIVVNDSNGRFSVTAGGTLSNNTYHWYRNNSLFETIIGDSTFTVTSPGTYSVAVSNSIVTKFEYSYSNLVLYSDTIIVSDTAILSDTPHIKYANREYTDKSGWTHYYFDNNTPNNYEDDTLILSLNKYGQNIGSIGDGTFSVKLEATAGAGSGTGIKVTNSLITNPAGFLVMNRYWQVTPTFQPSKDVGVRFYYNDQDLNDVNGSYPTHDLTDSQLIFYKSIGGNPDPTTNLAGATAIISIMPSTYASDTTWTYHQLTDSTQYAEFAVASFLGGGGGRIDNQAQPPTISSFTPTSGSLRTDVTITGKNFSGTTSVSFGGTNASSFIVNNDSTITAVVGNGATGNVKIETSAGKDSLQLFTFTCDSVRDTKPTITSIGDSILVSSNASYYNWYFNNKKLENETSHSLNVSKAGFYHVETSYNNICWTTSFDYVVLKNPAPLNDTLKMSVYPNPSQGNFTVDIKLPQTTTVTTYTTIYDLNGNKVLQTNKLIFFGNEIKVPVTLNIKGTFFVKVFVNGDSRQQTVIVQ